MPISQIQKQDFHAAANILRELACNYPLSIHKSLSDRVYEDVIFSTQNHLKNDKYGKWFIDKGKHTNKEIEAFRYNQAGIDCIRKLL